MPKLTSYDKATIKEWYAVQGYTQAELAEMYGVSRSTIQRVINEPDFLPENYEVGNLPTVDEQDLIHENESMGMDESIDRPEMVIGYMAVGITIALAIWVGWVIYNAL